MTAAGKDTLKEAREGIVYSMDRWEHIRTYGCSDPGWPDGDNRNLCRNHMVSWRRRLAEICDGQGIRYPDEFYLPVPPEVPGQYMAEGADPVRVERLEKMGFRLWYGKVEYDNSQLCFC